MSNKPRSTPRVQLYRQTHPRIDYHPAPDVLQIIRHYVADGEKCVAGVLDGLIRAGHRKVSGNGR
jgi:hypothetical protein